MRDEPEKQEYFYHLGEEHFFLAGHNTAAFLVLEPYLEKLQAGIEEPLRILDAGCGTGNFLTKLQCQGKVFGTDYSSAALEFCLKRHRVPVFAGDLNYCAVQKDSLDVVTALEVIEHIEDDQAALAEFYRVLKPGGIGLVTVPAMPVLWSPHDEWFGHFRRYRKKELLEKLNDAGFTVLRCHFLKCYLFLPMLVFRWIRKILRLYGKKKDDFFTVFKWLNDLLKWLIVFEAKSGIQRIIPFGTHLVCIVRKDV